MSDAKTKMMEALKQAAKQQTSSQPDDAERQAALERFKEALAEMGKQPAPPAASPKPH